MVVVVVASAPNESPERNHGENMRVQKTQSGTLHTSVGDSHFYSKVRMREPYAAVLRPPARADGYFFKFYSDVTKMFT